MRKEVILILHIGYAVGRITVAPRNAAVVAGDMMSMECRTDEDFRVRRWELLKVGGGPINVYSHGPPSRYDQEFTHFGVRVNASGSGMIYTNSTRMNDSGLYTCVTRQGPDAKTVKVTAQLTVFESQPLCETNMTAFGKKLLLTVGDNIWFRCSVAFRGFWTPRMEWRQHSVNRDTENVLTGGFDIIRLPDASVTSTLAIKVDSSMKGVFFSCRTYFTDEDIHVPFNETANNIPNFNYTWNSEAVELPTYQLQEAATESSSIQILLVVCLFVFLVLMLVAVTLICISKGKRVRGMLHLLDTDGRPSMQLDQSTHETHPSAELNSETVETEGREMAATNAGYCSLTGVSQEPKVYCPLRLQVPQNSDYVNLPSNQQRLPNEFPVYCNVTHM